MGSGTYSRQWSCLAPDSQYRVSKSHPYSIPTQSGSHRAMNSTECDLSTTAPNFSSWFHRSPKRSVVRLVHWVTMHLGSDWWSAWPDNAEEPLWGRWIFPRTPPWPCPSVVVMQRGPVWGSWPSSSSFLEGVSSGKKNSRFLKWAYCIILQ